VLGNAAVLASLRQFDNVARMDRGRIAEVVVVAMMPLPSGCGRAPADGRQLVVPDEAAGSYLRACAWCHGRDGRGSGPVAGALATTPSDLTTLAARHGGVFPRAYVLDVVTGARTVGAHGTQEMPVWHERFGSSVHAVASAHARRQLDLLVSHVEAMQSGRPLHVVP
jgi:hypothetical protein